MAGGVTRGKVRLTHLTRKAIVYVRQSTARQVRFNEESTRRQYALSRELVEMGWPKEMVEVIDEDLGVSGSRSDNRPGFQRLVGEVANGAVGVVASIEASRLSRSGPDWARIIDYCAMTDTLIMDEDATYDPNDPNDRLLLGVKGSISEMELHNIKLRMDGGLKSKLARGELRVPLPVGYVYDPLDRIVFDPAEDVRAAVEALFSTFEAKGSAGALVRHFREHGMKFPKVARNGPTRGIVTWDELTVSRATTLLRNPMYAGRYVYGRTETRHTPQGKSLVGRDEADWLVNIPGHHPAYVTEERFRANVETLDRNAASWRGGDPSTPGRGNALLQGMVWCGRCGRRMMTTYQMSAAKGGQAAFPLYVCDGDRETGSHTRCMQVNGVAIDEMVGELAASRISDAAVREAAEARMEVRRRWDEVERALEKQAERARYEADLMKRRYLACDPDNALVRIALEDAYEESLARVVEAEAALDTERAGHTAESDEAVLSRLDGLAEDFRSVWEDPEVDQQARKRLLRTVIDSVTLTREGSSGTCLVQVLYTGGGTEEFRARCTFYGPNSVSWRVKSHLEAHGTEFTPSELADQLNSRGLYRTNGNEWTGHAVRQYMSNAGIENRRQHYRSMGWLTTSELAEAVGISKPSIDARVKRGVYDGMWVMATDKTKLFSPEAAKHDLPKGRWGHRHQTER